MIAECARCGHHGSMHFHTHPPGLHFAGEARVECQPLDTDPCALYTCDCPDFVDFLTAHERAEAVAR